MRLSTLLAFAALSRQATYACPQNNLPLQKVLGGFSQNRAPTNRDWNYDNSYDWGKIKPNYTLCQTGTLQSPIDLPITPSISRRNQPSISSNFSSVEGELSNWGYGASFVVTEKKITARPSITYQGNNKNFLDSWHIHAPSEHTINGYRARAELHIVHTDSNGIEAGVFALLLDPGLPSSAFVSQFIDNANVSPGSDTTNPVTTRLNMSLAFEEVRGFREYWTYMGSLTSPPCNEGIRWWVAKETLFVSTEQMQKLLRISAYSARVEQKIWAHRIGV
ncbi:BgTH12-01034 [Blumeria graminis f. sp. triticale]|uniref:BgTH12-01034 n=1 Tax=Blumeria graminis f. sp. triticale TaxID=1689686 RepID=A0A9W4DPE7_BLUGR|nr:BgTH12-01034 [Blumeria graminis f. sp. triticale]